MQPARCVGNALPARAAAVFACDVRVSSRFDRLGRHARLPQQLGRRSPVLLYGKFCTGRLYIMSVLS